MERLNILVTGGAGFVGRHLIRALDKEKYHVTSYDNYEPQVHGRRYKVPKMKGVQYVRGDVRSEVLRGYLEATDIVIHLAAQVGVGQSMYEIPKYVEHNTMGTANLCQMIRDNPSRLKKLIVASSMSIYGEGEVRFDQCLQKDYPTGTDEHKPLDCRSIYAITKRDQEELCLVTGRSLDIPTYALRFFNIYGPEQALNNPYTGVVAIFAAQLLNNRSPIIFEDGQQSRDFIHVSDIVSGIIAAIENPFIVYQPMNLGTGIPTTIEDIAYMLADILGKEIKPTITNKKRAGDIRHCFARNLRAKNYLHWEPKVNLEDGLKEYVDWLKTQNTKTLIDTAIEELENNKLLK